MIKATLICLALTAAFSFVQSDDTYPCNAKTLETGTVCVCDSTYCDKVPTLGSLETSGSYQLYTTSSQNAGFQSTLDSFTQSDEASQVEIVVDSTIQAANHSIFGFGGAFTDSAGYNIVALPEAAQDNLLESYFGDDGIEYSFGRVPIGGADFSLRYYSYDDNEDPTLANFTLQDEDLTYKIPLLRKAKQLRNGKEFKLFASVWTAPPWMKTNNDWVSGGYLKDEYYQTWADYFVKFFEAYADQDVTFWGVTNQNEPSSGFIEFAKGFTGMAWLPEQITNWIGTNLGPTLRKSQFSDLKIITHDDQRYLLPMLNWWVLSNETALQYIDGVAVHYYGDAETSEVFLDFAYTDKKDLFLLATEACAGYLNAFGQEDAVVLGSWARAEQYLTSIFQDLRKGATGFVDWNIALDVEGGPVLIDNAVDSPIIVNVSAGEFYKQPMFYAMGHFSKFVVPGSVLVNSEVTINDDSNVQTLAFLRPDKLVALVIWNQEDQDVTVSITNNAVRNLLTVQAKSLNTLLYSV